MQQDSTKLNEIIWIFVLHGFPQNLLCIGNQRQSYLPLLI